MTTTPPPPDCPAWCEATHDRPPPDPEGAGLHSTEPVEVGGLWVAIESADRDVPEVHVWGEGDLALAEAPELAGLLARAADRLSGVLGGGDLGPSSSTTPCYRGRQRPSIDRRYNLDRATRRGRAWRVWSGRQWLAPDPASKNRLNAVNSTKDVAMHMYQVRLIEPKTTLVLDWVWVEAGNRAEALDLRPSNWQRARTQASRRGPFAA